MVDPVCVHGCDPGHVSPVSDSCSPAGYPHVAEVFSLSFVFSPYHCGMICDVVALRLAI
jgi:hypothetical protein